MFLLPMYGTVALGQNKSINNVCRAKIALLYSLARLFNCAICMPPSWQQYRLLIMGFSRINFRPKRTADLENTPVKRKNLNGY